MQESLTGEILTGVPGEDEADGDGDGKDDEEKKEEGEKQTWLMKLVIMTSHEGQVRCCSCYLTGLATCPG